MGHQCKLHADPESEAFRDRTRSLSDQDGTGLSRAGRREDYDRKLGKTMETGNCVARRDGTSEDVKGLLITQHLKLHDIL